MNYREVEDAIYAGDAYDHASSHATVDLSKDGDVYKVYSYDTLILVIVDYDITYFDGTKYNRTISRLQNIIRSCYPELPKSAV